VVGRTRPAGECRLFYEKGNEKLELGTSFFFVQKRIMSTVKKFGFADDSLAYNTKRSSVSYNYSERSCPNKG
jgi:hypothetical protein